MFIVEKLCEYLNGFFFENFSKLSLKYYLHFDFNSLNMIYGLTLRK